MPIPQYRPRISDGLRLWIAGALFVWALIALAALGMLT